MLLKFLFYNILFLLLIHEDNIFQENLRCVVRLLSLPTFGKLTFSYDCLIRKESLTVGTASRNLVLVRGAFASRAEGRVKYLMPQET